MDKAEIGNIVDKNSIFFGDQRISDIDLNRLVWDGSSSLSRMWLPKDRDAEQMGVYKPDLDAYDRYTKFEEWIEDNPNVSRQRMIEKLHEYDLDLEFDTETNRWKFRPEDMMVFLDYQVMLVIKLLTLIVILLGYDMLMDQIKIEYLISIQLM